MMLSSFVNGMNTALALSTRPAEASIGPFERGYLERQPYLWSKGRFDAAIIVSPNRHDMEVLARRETGIPTVLYNRRLPGYFSVSIDHDEVAGLAVDRAMELGGDDIVLIPPEANLYGADARVKKFLELYAQKGYDIRDKLISSANDIDSGYEVGQRLLLEKRLGKVIVCIYDVVALGVVSALRNSGIQVGRDVQVIAMSSIYKPMVHRICPEIQMIDMRLTEVATLTVNMAIDAGNRTQSGPRELVLQPAWSTGSGY